MWKGKERVSLKRAEEGRREVEEGGRMFELWADRNETVWEWKQIVVQMNLLSLLHAILVALH